MDTERVTASELANALGVSLPSAHRIFDAAGVAAGGKGARRLAPRSVLEDRILAKGGVPLKASARSSSQLRVLAALSRRPLGLTSARQVASVAGISPTVASRELRTLAEEGLVARTIRTVAAGSAKRAEFWEVDPTSKAWTPALRGDVRAVRLPAPQPPQEDRLPIRLRHHFWNADPDRLDVGEHASYIAGRLLTSKDVSAWSWALRNLSREDLSRAVTRRGVDDRTRAIVENWMRHE